MTAQMEEVTREESKASLIDQLHEKREQQDQEREKNAFQEQKADEIHVRESSEDSQRMGGGSEEEEETHDSEREEKGKSFLYSLGEEEGEIDENAIFELKADGKTMKMTLKEMRDAAAGGVAVRNRMRQLSDERKKLYTPYKDFYNIASKDPLGALKKVFSAIKQVDPKADMNSFLVGLGKQAQSLAKMSPSERKAYQLEKELDETRETLTESERIAKIQDLKQELIGEMGMSEEQVFDFGQRILSDPTLAETVKNEEDLFDRIGDLHDEIERQQAVIAALQKHDPKLEGNDPLVFELSALLEKNPDFDESDLEEIAEGILKGVKKSNVSRVLSKRQRSNAVRGYKAKQQPNYSRMAPKDALKQQILQKRNSQQH